MTEQFRIRLALVLTYVLFAMLLNSVGVVILQVITEWQISKTDAALLEACKDLPIALVSFLCASLLPRLGYRRALQIALLMVSLAAVAMPLLPAFLTTKLLFIVVGCAFALVKISVYALIGLLTHNQQQHAALLNLTEGFFMVGVLISYWLFAAFIGSSAGWLSTYFVLSGLAVFIFGLVSSCRFPASPAVQETVRQSFQQMYALVLRPLVAVFVMSAFLYVLIEQSIGTWLPTYNNQVLALPAQISVQLTSIFAASLALGRIGASWVLRYVSALVVARCCLIAMAALILFSLPLATPAPDITSIWQAPLAACLLPMIGLFMAPLYPMLNSAILSSLPQLSHAGMTGLIVLFSALGGSAGSLLTGYSFSLFGAGTAFYITLVPTTLLLLTAEWFFRRTAQPQSYMLDDRKEA